MERLAQAVLDFAASLGLSWNKFIELFDGLLQLSLPVFSSPAAILSFSP